MWPNGDVLDRQIQCFLPPHFGKNRSTARVVRVHWPRSGHWQSPTRGGPDRMRIVRVARRGHLRIGEIRVKSVVVSCH